MFMRKLSLLLLMCFLSTSALADSIRALVKVTKDQHGTQLFRDKNEAPIPSIEFNQNVKEQIEALKNGDEVIVVGHIRYHSQGLESQSMKPFFIIESVHPISLQRLGTIDTSINDQPLKLKAPEPFSPLTLPVSTEVASAITMTSSLLLLESLSAGSDPHGRREMQKSLIISAGTMATIIFIYDQIKNN
jgi:hypothetical protein